ncbi:hypothetical protein [Paenibacillus thalictri]|uniref:Uncharacterized protein n=1 Tax=Paenibacillus thalictri TaxID=2527873 RepID=A0A4Q9DS07_9BACL|nr:hypothetical protein [Paenibacillus thalictri]TBL77675.1 hypothetical protein EYB31_16125 [Paenibacillus thalictri]
MARLEYRLYEETGEFPMLYYYEDISEEEIAMRFACHYFVKDDKVYGKTSVAVEADCFVVYVQEDAEERTVPDWAAEEAAGAGICVELREYKEDADNYPLVCEYTFADNKTALLYLLSDYLYEENTEWYKTSAEIDEDRAVYVIYAAPAEQA